MEEGEGESRGGEAETSSIWETASPRGGRDACQQNGFINTHRLGAECQKKLLLVCSAPEYQGCMLLNTCPQQERSSGEGCEGEGAAPQLLNPSALLPHQAVLDPCVRPPGFFLCPESVLRAWGESGVVGCSETTFIEGPDTSSSTKEVLLFADRKFQDFCAEEAKIHTLSFDDDNGFRELEVSTLNLLISDQCEGYRLVTISLLHLHRLSSSSTSAL